MGKKNQNQDIESRLRELTERTRQTRRELEEMINRSDAERARTLADDKGHPTPQFFRRRRSRREQ